MRLMTLLFLVGLLYATETPASDLERERRMAEQISDAILVGEPMQLEADGVAFLAIYAEAETEPAKGAVILLHGRGVHPDWPDVISPLRTELPAAGWDTLSIQLPVAAADAPSGAYEPLIAEGPPRIQAAVDFLAEREVGTIVLLGHSLGLRMATEYLAGNPSPEVRGLVATGMFIEPDNAELRERTLNNLRNIRIPVLDIYGSEDLEGVRASAADRLQAARQGGNPDYEQVEVPGANHFFHDRQKELTRRVEAWLDGLAGGH